METKEELEQLQQEVARLQQQIQQQYAQLQAVQQRLQRLLPHSAPPPNSQQQSASLENFIGLRIIHLIGIVVLVIGFSIGVKYAFDRELISEAARILLAYAAGGVLLFLSLRLRKSYALFSAILFSGAMATFYFTTYAAYVYYALMPFLAAFIIMVLLTVVTAVRAVQYNRPEIALLGLVGAYSIPFLISKNAEQASAFFLYITIINLGVLYLHIQKSWRQVGSTAQLLTWLLFVGWCSTRFTPAQTTTGILFLSLFFILFSASVLYAAFWQKKHLMAQDAQLQLINNIALYVSLIFIVTPAYNNTALALISIGCGLGSALQALLFKKFIAPAPYLQKLHWLWGVLLVVFAVAFYFDGLAVTLVWLLLAVAIFAVGIRQKSKLWRLASLALIGVTLLKLLLLDSQRFTAGQKVIAYVALGLLLLIVSFLYQKFKEKWFGEE